MPLSVILKKIINQETPGGGMELAVKHDNEVAMVSLKVPSVPAVAWKIIHALGDSSLSSQELERIITMDQSLTAHLLKIANSPRYSFGYEIGNVRDAIMRIGYDTVRSAVVMTSLSSLRRRLCDTDKRLWEHSLAVGVASTIIAHNLRPGQMTDIFVPALLHDIGKNVLNSCVSDTYAEVVKQVVHEGVSFLSAERMFFSITHVEIGAYAADIWRLPKNIVSIIELHHSENINEHPDSDTRNKLLVIRIANTICARLGFGLESPSENEMEILEFFGVKDPAWLDRTISEVQETVPRHFVFFEK